MPVGDGSQLLLELGVAAAMMLAMTLVHALGLFTISRSLRLKGDRLEEQEFGPRAIGLMCATALALFALHTIEIWMFALLFLGLSTIETLEGALYVSASAYTTLGTDASLFPAGWRLLAAVEALIGFLLIGWSTAFIVSKLGKLLPD